jgi:metal-dependent amidase/aminoacylase/carboxypeptidase family protein
MMPGEYRAAVVSTAAECLAWLPDLPLTTGAVLDCRVSMSRSRGTSTSGLVVSLNGTKPGSQSGRTILLRADMDALPMPEEKRLEAPDVMLGWIPMLTEPGPTGRRRMGPPS